MGVRFPPGAPRYRGRRLEKASVAPVSLPVVVVVAQLVRASGCDSEGRRFDPGQPPQVRKTVSECSEAVFLFKLEPEPTAAAAAEALTKQWRHTICCATMVAYRSETICVRNSVHAVRRKKRSTNSIARKVVGRDRTASRASTRTYANIIRKHQRFMTHAAIRCTSDTRNAIGVWCSSILRSIRASIAVKATSLSSISITCAGQRRCTLAE
jgi:hypothetical protein